MWKAPMYCSWKWRTLLVHILLFRRLESYIFKVYFCSLLLLRESYVHRWNWTLYQVLYLIQITEIFHVLMTYTTLREKTEISHDPYSPKWMKKRHFFLVEMMKSHHETFHLSTFPKSTHHNKEVNPERALFYLPKNLSGTKESIYVDCFLSLSFFFPRCVTFFYK